MQTQTLLDYPDIDLYTNEVTLDKRDILLRAASKANNGDLLTREEAEVLMSGSDRELDRCMSRLRYAVVEVLSDDAGRELVEEVCGRDRAFMELTVKCFSDQD